MTDKNALGQAMSPHYESYPDPYGAPPYPDDSIPVRMGKLLLGGIPGSGGTADILSGLWNHLFPSGPHPLGPATWPASDVAPENPNFRQRPWEDPGRAALAQKPGGKRYTPEQKAQAPKPAPTDETYNPAFADDFDQWRRTLEAKNMQRPSLKPGSEQ
jgi:hypothetical protein